MSIAALGQAFRRCLLSIAILVPALAPAAENKPPGATQQKSKPWFLPELLRRVAPLTHDARGRLPMICITPFRMSAEDKSFEEGRPLPTEMIRQLKARGLTQFLYPQEKYLPYAKALQREQAGVIVLEASAFNGPGGEDEKGQAVADWLHVLPKGYKGLERPPQQPRFPCPLLLEGWRRKAELYRSFFRKCKAEGIQVQGVWLDQEVEPYGGEAQWREAQACSRCRALFPAGVLDDHQRYRAFIGRWRNELFSAYLVAPVLESFPRCAVTNWHEVISSLEIPTPGWTGEDLLPPRGIGMYTAANPVVYGNTLWYSLHWKKEWNWPLDAAHMDRLYTHVMLAQISAHEANARRLAPEKLCIPWVDRFCADDRDPKIPILSRGRYREILRHCWLRGADSMQIFNPVWFDSDPLREAIVAEEVEDAVAVYDEMLAFRELLDAGVTLGLAVPEVTDDGPIWSGRRLKDRAVVRLFSMGPKPLKARIRPFDQAGEIELDCPPQGATYLLERQGDKVRIGESGRNIKL